MAEVQGVSGDQLKQLIERIERLEEERSEIGATIREVYAEGKHMGFDPKIMRIIIRMRKMDRHELDEQELLVDVYKQALEMI